MLKIIHIATNTEFELPANITIPFMLYNPIFEEQGSTTYSATMSGASDINKRLTNYQHRPGKQNNGSTLIPVWLVIGAQKKRCTLNVLEADKETIKFNLLIDEGSFIATHGETLLNSLDYGGEKTLPAYSVPAWTNVIHQKTYPEVDAAFPPVYNDAFYDGSPFETNYKAHCNILNMPVDKRVLTPYTLFPECPAPFLNFIINRVFENFGHRVVDNHLNTPTFKNLVLLNNVEIVTISVHVVDGEGQGRTMRNGRYDIKNHVPEKTIRSFLKSLRGKFNTVCFVNENSNSVRLVCFDDILKAAAKTDYTKYCAALHLKKIPEYDGMEFVENGEKTPAFAEKYIDISDVSTKLILPALTDISNGIFKLNGVYILGSDDDFWGSTLYQLQIDPDDPTYYSSLWVRLGNPDLGNVITGTDGKRFKFETEFGFTPEGGSQIDSTYYTMPKYQAQGISEHLDYNMDKNFGMILAFYLPATEQVGSYPRASATNTGETVNYTHNLIPGTQKGTVNTFFKHTIDMYLNRGRIYETIITLPVHKLFNLDFAEKIIIESGVYLIKNIKGEFSNTGIEYKSAELVEV